MQEFGLQPHNCTQMTVDVLKQALKDAPDQGCLIYLATWSISIYLKLNGFSRL